MLRPDCQTISLTDHRCPECGAPLATNGELVWCSTPRAGTRKQGGPERICPCGISEKVTAEQHREGS